MCDLKSNATLWQTLKRHLSAWPPLVHAYGIGTAPRPGDWDRTPAERQEKHRLRIYW